MELDDIEMVRTKEEVQQERMDDKSLATFLKIIKRYLDEMYGDEIIDTGMYNFHDFIIKKVREQRYGFPILDGNTKAGTRIIIKIEEMKEPNTLLVIVYTANYKPRAREAFKYPANPAPKDLSKLADKIRKWIIGTLRDVE